MPFLSPNQQCQSTEGKMSHSMDLLTPSSPGGLPTLSLTTNSSWLPWGRVAMSLITPLIPVPQYTRLWITHIIHVLRCSLCKPNYNTTQTIAVVGVAFSAWILLIWWDEGQPACKNGLIWLEVLTINLHVTRIPLVISTTLVISCCSIILNSLTCWDWRT